MIWTRQPKCDLSALPFHEGLYPHELKQFHAPSGSISSLRFPYAKNDTPNSKRRCAYDGRHEHWSRSRKCLWHKGATSGLIQKVVEIRIDDDQDAVWLRVNVEGEASCHVGYRSCFYRAVSVKATEHPIELTFTETKKVFDPVTVYGNAPNPTKL